MGEPFYVNLTLLIGCGILSGKIILDHYEMLTPDWIGDTDIPSRNQSF